ncbi:hypothetical protein C8N24_1423 [Solirubrobacter pauli]|uniref:YCII-related domain-containing protein n=1 Tax=Solirubrobacter pauli TaxID=166793 RepID=A0A660LCK7_9ACTN|nr:YciI family protein [Solirubrobacter pauli]RKQ91600.1 hypothetical protein C8N24_1423 [Solirubrobacter pauli]
MHYVLTLHYRDGEGPEMGTPEFEAEMKVWNALNDEMKAAGVIVGVGGLSPETATTLRTRGGEEIVTDGPFAETKEILFSLYVIDVEDLDAALAWARRMPATEYGSVQIHASSYGFQTA